MALIGIVHLCVTALLVAVCVPLLRHRIPRNHWYGVRIPASLASDAAWYAYNEYFARRMLAWSVPFGLWALGEIFFINRVPLPWRHVVPLGSLAFIAIPIIETIFWRPPPQKPRP